MENESIFTKLEKLISAIEALTVAVSQPSSNSSEFALATIALFITIVFGWIAIAQQKRSEKQFEIITETNKLAVNQQRISILENNIDVLQRLNETALSSPENLEAAFTSVNETDENTGEFNQKAARETFFHYLRINRMYRAWLLKENKLIKPEEYNLIVDNYAGTLKRAESQLKLLSRRGYDEKFITEISSKISDAEPAPPISLS